MSDPLDTLTNEIEQGFMQRGGWKACRYAVGKLVKKVDESYQKREKTQQSELERLRAELADCHERIRRLTAMVYGRDIETHCASCGNLHGHAPDCEEPSEE